MIIVKKQTNKQTEDISGIIFFRKIYPLLPAHFQEVERIKSAGLWLEAELLSFTRKCPSPKQLQEFKSTFADEEKSSDLSLTNNKSKLWEPGRARRSFCILVLEWAVFEDLLG